MKKKSMFLSVFLAFVMLVTYMPVLSFASGSYFAHFSNRDIFQGIVGTQDINHFFEKGSLFSFSYAEGEPYKRVYKYYQNPKDGDDYGFYVDGDPTKEEMFMYWDINDSETGNFKLGDNEVTFHYKSADGEWHSFIETVKGVYEPYVDLNKNVFTYDGKTHKPTVSVYYYNDESQKEIVSSADYLVKYSPSNCKKPGEYTVTVTFFDTDTYIDSVSEYYQILPRKCKVTKVTRGKRKITVKWKKFSKKQLKYIDGFRIVYSTDPEFEKGVKTKYVKKKYTKATIKKLKKGKRYYVKVYSYKKVNKKKVFSRESNIKSAKVK